MHFGMESIGQQNLSSVSKHKLFYHFRLILGKYPRQKIKSEIFQNRCYAEFYDPDLKLDF